MKKLRIVAIAGLILVAALALMAWAGDKDKMSEGKMDMSQMKEMFSKCYMCKNMVPYMEKAWYPTLSWEIYDTKNGMLMLEHVGDKSGMADYKTLFAAFEKAGNEVEGWTAEKAEAQLCEHCQGMFSMLKAGAVDDWALTKDGSVCSIVSDNPETVKLIHAQSAKMRQMMGME